MELFLLNIAHFILFNLHVYIFAKSHIFYFIGQHQLPTTWTNAPGHGERFNKVTLDPNSPEYLQVKAEFEKTARGLNIEKV